MKQDWTDKMREKLAEHTETPPAGLWDEIDARLKAQKVPTPSQNQKPKNKNQKLSRHRMTWACSAAACLLLLATIVIKQKAPTTPIETNYNSPNKSAVATTTKPVANLSNKSAVATTTSVGANYYLPNKSNNGMIRANDNSPQQNENQPVEQDETSTQHEPSTPQEKTTRPNQQRPHRKAGGGFNVVVPPHSQSRHQLALNVFTSQGAAATGVYAGSDYKSNYQDPPIDIEKPPHGANNDNAGNIANSGNENNDTDEDEEKNDDQPSTRSGTFGGIARSANANPSDAEHAVLINAKHRQPLRLGLSLSYPLTPQFSVNAGLTFTRLSSDIEYSYKALRYFADQTLLYVGIPIAATYQVATLKPISVYLTAGGMAEQCVYGNAKLKLPYNMQYDPATEGNIRERRPQFSLFCGGGVQANITNTLSLYAEPLLTHYIDNHSDAVNIYKDKPTNFDIRIGVRITPK